jgi:hypothetical protein
MGSSGAWPRAGQRPDPWAGVAEEEFLHFRADPDSFTSFEAPTPIPLRNAGQGVAPIRVSSTKRSVAASIARPLRPRGGWM